MYNLYIIVGICKFALQKYELLIKNFSELDLITHKLLASCSSFIPIHSSYMLIDKTCSAMGSLVDKQPDRMTQ